MSDSPVMNSKGSPDRCRTVVVSGVPDVLPSSRMSDKLTIHFQSARSHGGDVEEVEYPTHLKGVAFVTFESWRDADKVVKCNQVLKDREFQEEYPLTVYMYTPEVALYAFADVDLSLYPDLSTLIASLRSTHGSVRIQPDLTKAGFISAEGPFSALRELRKDLLSRAPNRDISDKASSLFKASSPDKARQSAVDGTDIVKLWLDTHTYKYFQMVQRKDWDRCVSRYDVIAQAVSTGEVTEVELHGDKSVLSAAQTELQKLVAERQGTLRTQQIDCSSSDLATRTRLLQACERVQSIYKDVCYAPTDSYIEVIGPSVSSHLFCGMVKIVTDGARI
ncbi:RNA-binding protein 43-like [Salminus brasiliensis]|uniref:RNA-binding protein 43-like n=1 Tax=Salminus brasiliensis TaxID=930266 RepID=UPI003B8358F7